MELCLSFSCPFQWCLLWNMMPQALYSTCNLPSLWSKSSASDFHGKWIKFCWRSSSDEIEAASTYEHYTDICLSCWQFAECRCQRGGRPVHKSPQVNDRDGLNHWGEGENLMLPLWHQEVLIMMLGGMELVPSDISHDWNSCNGEQVHTV